MYTLAESEAPPGEVPPEHIGDLIEKDVTLAPSLFCHLKNKHVARNR